MSYVDFFCVPLHKSKESAYIAQIKIFGQVMKEHEMLSYCEAASDDVPRGKVTDFYRAVDAKDDEAVVAAFCTWPDKATRDKAWELGMKDPRLNTLNNPEDRPFDGKRMIYGGFKPIFEM